MNNCLIWIVDDDTEDLDLLEQLFEEISLTVRKFNCNKGCGVLEALDATDEAQLPHLLILDVNMPGMSGKELLSIIRGKEKLRHLPVAVFTTSSSKNDKAECMQLGANCFVTKPFDYDRMRQICSHLATLFCRLPIQTRKSYLSVPKP